MRREELGGWAFVSEDSRRSECWVGTQRLPRDWHLTGGGGLQGHAGGGAPWTPPPPPPRLPCCACAGARGLGSGPCRSCLDHINTLVSGPSRKMTQVTSRRPRVLRVLVGEAVGQRWLGKERGIGRPLGIPPVLGRPGTGPSACPQRKGLVCRTGLRKPALKGDLLGLPSAGPSAPAGVGWAGTGMGAPGAESERSPVLHQGVQGAGLRPCAPFLTP